MLLGKLVSFAGYKITRRYTLGTSLNLKCVCGWVSWLLLKYIARRCHPYVEFDNCYNIAVAAVQSQYNERSSRLQASMLFVSNGTYQLWPSAMDNQEIDLGTKIQHTCSWYLQQTGHLWIRFSNSYPIWGYHTDCWTLSLHFVIPRCSEWIFLENFLAQGSWNNQPILP